MAVTPKQPNLVRLQVGKFPVLLVYKEGNHSPIPPLEIHFLTFPAEIYLYFYEIAFEILPYINAFSKLLKLFFFQA